jgi:hypothetical protein
MRARFLGAILAAAVSLTVSHAGADEARVNFLSDKLKSDDFRVRTNAALALGAADDDKAVDPLCNMALADNEVVVRQAAAVALKRLNRGAALACLKDRADKESDDGVKVQITRAIEALNAGSAAAVGGGLGDDTIKDVPNAKYYIAVSSISNSTGRAQPEVEGIVGKAVRGKLDADGTIQRAPAKEESAAAKDKLSKRKMKGFYLAIAVDKFDYSGGNLVVKVKIGVFSYPSKSLIGNVDKTVRKEGVSPGDKASEDAMLQYAAEKAAQQFAENASAFAQ